MITAERRSPIRRAPERITPLAGPEAGAPGTMSVGGASVLASHQFTNEISARQEPRPTGLPAILSPCFFRWFRYKKASPTFRADVARAGNKGMTITGTKSIGQTKREDSTPLPARAHRWWLVRNGSFRRCSRHTADHFHQPYPDAGWFIRLLDGGGGK